MGMYSEKTQREVDKYFRRLVRRMPGWLRLLFDDDKIVFEIDPSGALRVATSDLLDERTTNNAHILIDRYFRKHPVPFLQVREIN